MKWNAFFIFLHLTGEVESGEWENAVKNLCTSISRAPISSIACFRSIQKIQLSCVWNLIANDYNFFFFLSFSRNVTGCQSSAPQLSGGRGSGHKTRISVWLISFVRDYMATYLDAAIVSIYLSPLTAGISYTFIRNYYILQDPSPICIRDCRCDWAVSVQLSSSLVFSITSHIVSHIFTSTTEHTYFFSFARSTCIILFVHSLHKRWLDFGYG